MSADIKSLRLRIRSTDSTLHLTNAMGLVASSKIRRANENMENAREYSKCVEETVQMLANCPECKKNPYLRSAPEENARTKLIVIAGDRGLCGGYNANIFRLMREHVDTEVITIGKRAAEKYGMESISSEKFSREDGYRLASKLCAEFLEGSLDKLGIVSSKYISIMSQEAHLEWILPIKSSKSDGTGSILFEPDEETVFDAAVPEYIAGKIMAAVRESFACEVAARRMAMDSAEKNAQKMISDLMLEYNRARQSSITQEITEIVAGSGN